MRFSKKHIWVKEDGDVVMLGLSEYAISELGGVMFVNLPDEDDEITVGEAFGDVESVKTVSDLISPVSGKVIEVNEEVIDYPEEMTGDEDSWMLKVKVSDQEELMTEEEYTAYLQSL